MTQDTQDNLASVDFDNLQNKMSETPETPEKITNIKIETKIPANPIINEYQESPGNLELFGLPENCKQNFNFVSIPQSKLRKNPEFVKKDSKGNAEIILGKTPHLLSKGYGFYKILKDQRSPVSDYLFIFNNEDYEAIAVNDKGRIDNGEEVISKLKELIDKEFIDEEDDSRGLCAAFVNQTSLLGKANTLVQKGEFCVVCAPNFFIPDKNKNTIAEITIKGKATRKVGGLKKLLGKPEKYLYSSDANQIVEEKYPIYSDTVDFSIDRCLFDNLTVLDIPEKRHVAILKDKDSSQWIIQHFGKETDEQGVSILDEQDEWFLIKTDLPDGEFSFKLCKGGKDDNYKVLEGNFRILDKKASNSRPVPSHAVKPVPDQNNDIKPVPDQNKNFTRVIMARGLSKQPEGTTRMNLGRRPKDSILQEFILTHRLIPFLQDKERINKSYEYVVPVGAPCEFIKDDKTPYLEIHFGFKDIQGKIINTDIFRIIPSKDIYLAGDATPFSDTVYYYTNELNEQILTFVDKPNISDITDANLRCILDFKHVPKDRNGEQYHWCSVNVDPYIPYNLDADFVLIGRSCYKSTYMDSIPEGYWDILHSQPDEDIALTDKLIEQYGYMDIMSSRYHGLFLKPSENITNISMSVPIFVTDKDGNQKAMIQPIDKKKLPSDITKLYARMGDIEKRRMTPRDREELSKLSSDFIKGLLSKELTKDYDKAKLESGDSVVIGLSKYMYIKRRMNESRSAYLNKTEKQIEKILEIAG